MALIAQLGEHCTGIAEVVDSNPAQSLNFFQVSVLVVFNGRICIYYRYHSIATMGAGWNYACAGAWPLSRKDVIAENKMAPLLHYFVFMAIIVSIEGRKDVFKCSVCEKNLSNLKAERRKFRAVSDHLFACFGPLEEESPHEPGKKFLCGTCRRALADFKRTGKTFFHVSKNAISQQSVTICVS